ncbi:MAG: AraC family transcriptional regulator [Chitinivibrionales bacterium]|nr:AraC family transcriptional regulator [Chitinivibrionales bacterium]
MKSDHFRKISRRARTGESIFCYHPLDKIANSYPLIIQWAGSSRWTPEDSYERKKSDVVGIEQVTAGNARFIQDQKEYIVAPGDVFLLRQGVHHFYTVGPAGFLHKRFVRLGGALLDSFLRTSGLWEYDVIRPQAPAALERLLKRADNILKVKQGQWVESLSLTAYELLMLLAKSIPHHAAPAVARALAFMEQNLARPLTNRLICEQAGVSMPHFNRLFKQAVGMAPMRYLISQRVAWAARLLQETGLSIKQVAVSVGYENQLYFSYVFKRHTGFSPKAYRAKLDNR